MPNDPRSAAHRVELRASSALPMSRKRRAVRSVSGSSSVLVNFRPDRRECYGH
jgi:hypothetical protein